MPSEPELIIDTPGPDEAEIPPIELLTLTLGVPEWSDDRGWIDSGQVYYEAELWSVDTSRDYIRALADELGINGAQGNGFVVEMRDGRHDIGATGLEVVDVLVLAVQAAGAVVLEHAFRRVLRKLVRFTREPDQHLTEDEAVEKARLRIATRYDTEAGRLKLIRTSDSPSTIEVELAESEGLPRYTVEFSRTGHAWKITRQAQM